MKNVTVDMSYKFSENVLYKYFYHMILRGIGIGILSFSLLLRQLSLYILHLSFCLCIHIYFHCLKLAQGFRVQSQGTLSSSNEPLTSNHAVFVCEHDLMLKLWEDSTRSRMMRFLKYLLCVLNTKWSFHLPWKCQACKREPP